MQTDSGGLLWPLMSGDVTDARPLQVRVADDLRALIETGRLAPGAKLPTLDELAAQYLCLRTTFDVSETAVEVMRAVIAADMAQFVYRFPFPD